MRWSLGLAVGAETLRAVLVRDGRAVWARELERPDGSEDEMLADAVAALLTEAPAPRWRRVRLTVALGPAHSQVKRLAGLPSLEDPALLAGIVREGAGRFFLRNGVPLLTSRVQPVGPGEAWAAAFDEPVVEAVRRGSAQVRVRLVRIVPSAVAVLGGVEGKRLVWVDGPVCAEVVRREGRLHSVRRRPSRAAGGQAAGETPFSETPPVEGLAALGEKAWRFADAYGAATLRGALPLAIASGTGGRDPEWVGGRRLRLRLALALWTGTAAAGLLSPLASERAARDARERLAIVADERWRTLAAAEAELAQVTSALSEIEALAASQPSVTLLLAELARALPDGTAVTTLRLDADAGSLTVVGTRTAEAVSRIERVPGVHDPALTGPISRETAGAREMERATIRFARRPSVLDQEGRP